MPPRTSKTIEDEIDRQVANVLSGDLFPGDDMNEKEVNEIATLIREHKASGEPKRMVTALRMMASLKTAVIRMYHGTDNPKEVPIKLIKHALQNPSPVRDPGSFARMEQRKSIDGPTKAIRIKCLECTGQDTVAVRQCASTNCVLWAFRMGSNPFFGRLHGAEDEASESEAEIEALEAQRMPTPAEQQDGNS